MAMGAVRRTVPEHKPQGTRENHGVHTCKLSKGISGNNKVLHAHKFATLSRHARYRRHTHCVGASPLAPHAITPPDTHRSSSARPMPCTSAHRARGHSLHFAVATEAHDSVLRTFALATYGNRCAPAPPAPPAVVAASSLGEAGETTLAVEVVRLDARRRAQNALRAHRREGVFAEPTCLDDRLPRLDKLLDELVDILLSKLRAHGKAQRERSSED